MLKSELGDWVKGEGAYLDEGDLLPNLVPGEGHQLLPANWTALIRGLHDAQAKKGWLREFYDDEV